MTASDKLNAKIAAMTTQQLFDASLMLTLATTPEEIIVCNRVERELECRVTEAEFLAHMDACEAMLDAA